MEDNVGRFYIYNGKVCETSNKTPVFQNASSEIYEVIRIIDGVPLFLQDHFNRMRGSAEAICEEMPFSIEGMSHQIEMLVRQNSNTNCNAKVIAVYRDAACDSIIYISKSFYPSADIYEKGVSVGTICLERQNPGIKLVNNEYKKIVSQSISEGGYFEVLLINKEGFITEGSRSNVFFVKEDKIFTAPGSSVLKGITRQYVIEACRNAGYEVVEKFVNAEVLDEIDGVFLSGTSIKVLPVSLVAGRAFNSAHNLVIKKVGTEFNRIIDDYIAAYRR